jgi:hypothetical protein
MALDKTIRPYFEKGIIRKQHNRVLGGSALIRNALLREANRFRDGLTRTNDLDFNPTSQHSTGLYTVSVLQEPEH